MTREEIDRIEQRRRDMIARGEDLGEDDDRFSWKGDDVLIFKNQEEANRRMEEEGSEFIPVEKMKKRRK